VIVVGVNPARGYAKPRAVQTDFVVSRNMRSIELERPRKSAARAAVTFDLRASPIAIDQALGSALYFNQGCFWASDLNRGRRQVSCVQ
jgi:hypothetical protein